MKYKLRDLSVWANRSLASLVSGLGIQIEEKQLLDSYKDRMHDALSEHSDDFVKYALTDVVILEKVV